MTQQECLEIIAGMVAAHNEIGKQTWETPRKHDTLKHLEWAISELAKRVWLSATGVGQ